MFENIFNNGLKYLAISFLAIAQFVGGIFGRDFKDGNELYVDTYPQTVLKTLWIEYADFYVQKDGRTIDRSRDYITTSEGQSYSLLRAVWMDDKSTFDKVLRWTNNNLRHREEDKLFAWQWGQNPDGSWGVLKEDGGMNTASDADQDIALALIFASKRWNDPRYIKQALVILDDIWETEVVTINGSPYLVAGNWAKDEDIPTINPSYFSVAAYPIFAEVDPNPDHDWLALRDTSYDVLEYSSKHTFSRLEASIEGEESQLEDTVARDTIVEYSSEDSDIYLPPDWIGINPETEEIVAPMHSDKSMNFSHEALRIPWRVALDYKWHKNPRAYEYLQRLNFFSEEWNDENIIYGEYDKDGNAVVDWESNSLYGGLMGYFSVVEPEMGREVYLQKLVSMYNIDEERFFDNENVGYYSENWIWFGIALYQNALPNLYSTDLSTLNTPEVENIATEISINVQKGGSNE